jgi:hypothetical protein
MNLNAKSWEAFFYAVVDGEINPKSAERLLKLTSSMAARKGISRILVDARQVTGTLLNSERVELAAKFADHVNKLGARPSVAFVGHPPAFNGFGGGRWLQSRRQCKVVWQHTRRPCMAPAATRS